MPWRHWCQHGHAGSSAAAAVPAVGLYLGTWTSPAPPTTSPPSSGRTPSCDTWCVLGVSLPLVGLFSGSLGSRACRRRVSGVPGPRRIRGLPLHGMAAFGRGLRRGSPGGRIARLLNRAPCVRGGRGRRRRRARAGGRSAAAKTNYVSLMVAAMQTPPGRIDRFSSSARRCLHCCHCSLFCHSGEESHL